MPNRETLDTGLLSAFWGYLFLSFDLNLNTVSLLPGFAGYLLLLEAASAWQQERPALAAVRPFGRLLLLWELACWLYSWTGKALYGRFLFLELLAASASLYFHFQLLTELAAAADPYQPETGSPGKRLRFRRTAFLIGKTGGSLFSLLPPGPLKSGAAAVWAAACTVVSVLLLSALFSLRKSFRESAAGASAEPPHRP